MTIAEMQREILRRKKERDVCILAHSYQAREILEIADITGDSYRLSVQAKAAAQRTLLMCGVRFMAETVKLLSPEKRVLLANSEAGCPMAEQMDKPLIKALRAQYPDYAVVAYINTTAETKTVCDVCVTSSSAVQVVRRMKAGKILFLPDCNLGDYVAKQVPEKTFKLFQGGCPIHARVTEDDVRAARRAHPARRCWCTPNARPTCCGRRISSVRPPPLWTMRRHLPKTRSLSAPKSASPRICRMLFPKSAFIRFPKIASART